MGPDTFDFLLSLILTATLQVGYQYHHLQMIKRFLGSIICPGHTANKWKRHIWDIALIPKPLPFVLPSGARNTTFRAKDPEVGKEARIWELWTAVQSSWSAESSWRALRKNENYSSCRKGNLHATWSNVYSILQAFRSHGRY